MHNADHYHDNTVLSIIGAFLNGHLNLNTPPHGLLKIYKNHIHWIDQRIVSCVHIGGFPKGTGIPLTMATLRTSNGTARILCLYLRVN